MLRRDGGLHISLAISLCIFLVLGQTRMNSDGIHHLVNDVAVRSWFLASISALRWLIEPWTCRWYLALAFIYVKFSIYILVSNLIRSFQISTIFTNERQPNTGKKGATLSQHPSNLHMEPTMTRRFQSLYRKLGPTLYAMRSPCGCTALQRYSGRNHRQTRQKPINDAVPTGFQIPDRKK